MNLIPLRIALECTGLKILLTSNLVLYDWNRYIRSVLLSPL